MDTKQASATVTQLLVGISMLLIQSGCESESLCKNSIISSLETEDGTPFFLISRDCGATTATSVIVWVGGNPERFNIASDQIVFLAEAEIEDIDLKSDGNNVILSFIGDDHKIFRMKKKFNNVEIIYGE